MDRLILAIAMGVVLVGGACSDKVGVGESPLATWDPSAYDVYVSRTAGEGTLDISAGCVLLITGGGNSVLLVWP